MGLETATYVDDLNTSNPDGAVDQKQQGDNHLRLIKTVLKNTFPGMVGRLGRAQSKGGNYTAVLNDNTSLLFFTAVATLSLTAVATLGNGWQVMVYAGGGDVVIDPSGSEEINGALTKTVKQGQIAVVMSTGIAGDEFTCLYPLSASEIQTMINLVWTTGDVKVTYKTVADTGWVMMNDGSIGNASSGGTTRANADTEALFTHLWNVTVDADCAVSGGRGGSAAADFAANKNIALPKTLGRELAVAGAGAGLTSRALASVLGTETKTIGTANLPASGVGAGTLVAADHVHQEQTGNTGSPVPARRGTGSISPVFPTITATEVDSDVGALNTLGSGALAVTGTTANLGSGTALDVMTPRFHANVMIKL